MLQAVKRTRESYWQLKNETVVAMTRIDEIRADRGAFEVNSSQNVRNL